MATKNTQKKLINYCCIKCDFYTCNKNDYNRHNQSKKHFSNTSQQEATKKTHICENCNKAYKDRTGLWRHKKKCSISSSDNEYNEYNDNEYNEYNENEYNNFEKKSLIDIDVIMELIKNNTEIQKKMLDVINNGTHNTTNNTNCNNTTNKTFNLNLYLNETCKNAMNISDFVSSIKFNLEDLEHTGKKGYVEGISNIFLKNLNNIEDHMRPIHCSDQKREILYIKDNDKWEKECDEKPILIKAIKNVAHQNIKQIQTWRDKNPDCTSSESRKNDLYLKIVSNSMNGLTEEEGKKNINKIISNVAKEVFIDKN